MTPQEARKELARRELARRQQAQAVSTQPQKHGAAYSLGAGIAGGLRGATLGASDHIEAGLSSLMPSNFMAGGADVRFGDYGGNLEKIRARNKAVEEQAPIASTAGKIGGAVIGVGKLGAMGKLPSQAIKGKGLGKTTLGLGADAAAIAGVESLFNGGDVGKDALQGGLLGAGLNVATRGAGSALAPLFKGKKPDLPDTKSLKDMANAAYQRVDDLGAKYTPEQVSTLFKGIADDIPQGGLGGVTSKTHPTTMAALKQIDEAKGQGASLSDLDKLRQLAGSAQVTNKADERMGGFIRDNIDEFTGSVTPANGTNAADAIADARKLFARAKKSELLDDMIYKATNRAGSTGSGGNIENATRQNVRRILDSPKLRRGFSADEIKQMEKVVRGTSTQNALRLAGKLSPEGNGLMAALGVGGTAANPLLATVPATGFVAKRGSESIANKNIDDLLRMVRAGSKDAARRPDTKISKAIADQKRQQEVARLLAAIGISGSQ